MAQQLPTAKQALIRALSTGASTPDVIGPYLRGPIGRQIVAAVLAGDRLPPGPIVVPHTTPPIFGQGEGDIEDPLEDPQSKPEISEDDPLADAGW
ncbi:MAG TPA: hypothetical protein VGH77_05185 [Streptosporangiaceae bacterium]